ncbi:MAG: cellulase family glycosylhydrolase [Gaiellaceae bacterium]
MSAGNGARPPLPPRARRQHGGIAALVVAGLLALGVLYAAFVHTSTAGLHVEGSQLVENGQARRLLGVGLSGTESACLAADELRSRGLVPNAKALRSWNVDTVLVPIAADCWLGAPGAGRAAGGAYQDAIQALVELLHKDGFAVVLSLDRMSPRGPQPPMPDPIRADKLWNQVGTAFKNDHRLLFDLYARPHSVGWGCWLQGCTRDGRKLAGMQEMVDAVRGANARQPVILRGLDEGGDLSGWLAHAPEDATGALVAGFRLADGSLCASRACWEADVAPITPSIPVVTAELSERDCAHGSIDAFMQWADAQGISYLGRAWRVGACRSPSLIRNPAGAPSGFGVGLRNHLRTLAGSG